MKTEEWAAEIRRRLSNNAMLWDMRWTEPIILEAIREAVAQEREACAAEIEKQCRMLDLIFGDGGHGALCRDLAEAVRKRGE
jgi:hypothetical protein